MLYATKTLELTIDHDTKFGAESLTLLHTMTGQHHTLATPYHLQNTVPEKSSGSRIHATCRFILNNIEYLTVLSDSLNTYQKYY